METLILFSIKFPFTNNKYYFTFENFEMFCISSYFKIFYNLFPRLPFAGIESITDCAADRRVIFIKSGAGTALVRAQQNTNIMKHFILII